MDLFLSPQGSDRWSGRLPEPNADATDGPLATLAKARDLVRGLKHSGRLDGPVDVRLRGGVYPLREPVVFGPQDSAPVTYGAYEGEQPILDGGERLSGWTVETVNGVNAWALDLPEVKAGNWYFRQLFVDGERRPRARLPKHDVYAMADVPGITLQAALFEGSDEFICQPGQIQAWRNLQDVEVVVVHYWIEERLLIETFDPETNHVKTQHRSSFALKDDFRPEWARYWVENVFEGLTEPGEWYLHRQEGRLYYLPKPGEDPERTEAVAPRATQLLKLAGNPDANEWVEFLRFEGLTFQHTDWHWPTVEPGTMGLPPNAANAYQAAFTVPGVIAMEGARNCAVEDCTVRRVGYYAVELGDGCTGNRIVGNELTDLGAGGVKLNGAAAGEPRHRRTGRNRITDNHIDVCGRVYHSACGIFSRHSHGNVFSHNHIHDLYYTGISVGWVWGYAENASYGNRIEKNHIHDLGHGLLSDMGGVYTLGVQPGTVIRGNLIHDVVRRNYGGWAIYPDEGSAHLLIEHNVCFRTDSQVFHQHYGRENVVRNNIFAFGAEAALAHGRADVEHRAFTFLRNIVLTDGAPIFSGGYGAKLALRNHVSDLNVYWDVSGKALTFKDSNGEVGLAEWQAFGHDQASLFADPKCADPLHGDFTLAEDSPAWGLGFEPIDLSDVGPRAKGERE